MSKINNVEIKAKCSEPKFIQDTLMELGADYLGCDHQVDTYFNCEKGRLKHRAGNIENSLIFYSRPDQAGPKHSDIAFSKVKKESNISDVLKAAYGVKAIVDKKRHIYFIDNVKFHVDEVQGLGSFMEIEAIDESTEIPLSKLQEQCEHYMSVLKIKDSDLITQSYSDLIFKE